MDNTKLMLSYIRKTSFFCTNALESCDPAHETPTKNQSFCIIFIFDSNVSRKMDHFDISFACSIFSKSWDVPNNGFLGAAYRPVSLNLWGWDRWGESSPASGESAFCLFSRPPCTPQRLWDINLVFIAPIIFGNNSPLLIVLYFDTSLTFDVSCESELSTSSWPEPYLSSKIFEIL